MRTLLLLALLAAPALAEPIPEVEAALDGALEEQRLLAACFGLDRGVQEVRAEQWSVEVAETVAALEAGGYDAGAIARFREQADPAALAPAPEETFLEVRDRCWARAEEVRALRTRWSQTFRTSALPGSLPAPFGSDDR
jgi:hypothetical protein